ncbi:hypothetical protein D4Q80_02230, partial [bacterium]
MEIMMPSKKEIIVENKENIGKGFKFLINLYTILYLIFGVFFIIAGICWPFGGLFTILVGFILGMANFFISSMIRRRKKAALKYLMLMNLFLLLFFTLSLSAFLGHINGDDSRKANIYLLVLN